MDLKYWGFSILYLRIGKSMKTLQLSLGLYFVDENI